VNDSSFPALQRTLDHKHVYINTATSINNRAPAINDMIDAAVGDDAMAGCCTALEKKD